VDVLGIEYQHPTLRTTKRPVPVYIDAGLDSDSHSETSRSTSVFVRYVKRLVPLTCRPTAAFKNVLSKGAVKVRDLVKQLEEDGWRLDRIKGVIASTGILRSRNLGLLPLPVTCPKTFLKVL
jgi:hypothetical protein